MVLIRRLLTLLLGSAIVARVATLLRSRNGNQRSTSPPAPRAPLTSVPDPDPVPDAEPEPAPAAEADPEPQPAAEAAPDPEPTPEPAPATDAEPGPGPAAAAAPEPQAVDTPADPASPGSYADPVDGACPEGFPVKVKLSSGIYHEPGGTHYGRVKPDRCYTSAAAAEADGFRSSKS